MDTGQLIAQLKATRDALRKKIEELRAQSEADLQNIEGTISFYERQGLVARSATLTLTANNPPTPFGVANIRNMTHKQAVIAIAKSNGGIVRAQEAKHMMIQAQIMRPTKNATRMVHNAIVSSGRFDRIAPGQYRLRPPTPIVAPAPASAPSAGLFPPKGVQ